jgi:hypothetical protein
VAGLTTPAALRRGEPFELAPHELAQVEPVVRGDALVHDGQLIVTQPAYGLRVDRAAMNPDERSNDRGVLLRQRESIRIEVIEARVLV